MCVMKIEDVKLPLVVIRMLVWTGGKGSPCGWRDNMSTVCDKFKDCDECGAKLADEVDRDCAVDWWNERLKEI